jgi:hypothetical protein
VAAFGPLPLGLVVEMIRVRRAAPGRGYGRRH